MRIVINAPEKTVRSYVNGIYFMEKRPRHTQVDGSIHYAGLLIGQYDLDEFPEVVATLRSEKDLKRGYKAYFATDHYHYKAINNHKTEVCLDIFYRSMDWGKLKNNRVSIIDNVDNPKLQNFFIDKRRQATDWLKELKLQVETFINGRGDWNTSTVMSCSSIPEHMRIVVKNASVKQIKQWLYQQYVINGNSTMLSEGSKTSFASRFAKNTDLDEFFDTEDHRYYSRDSYSFHATAQGMEVCLTVLYVFPKDPPPDTEISITEKSKTPKIQTHLDELQQQTQLWLQQLKTELEQ